MPPPLRDRRDALAPELARKCHGLDAAGWSGCEDFQQSQCAAPLPRACPWADASVYRNHARLVYQWRKEPIPERYEREPLVHQGGLRRHAGSVRAAKGAARWVRCRLRGGDRCHHWRRCDGRQCRGGGPADPAGRAAQRHFPARTHSPRTAHGCWLLSEQAIDALAPMAAFLSTCCRPACAWATTRVSKCSAPTVNPSSARSSRRESNHQ